MTQNDSAFKEIVSITNDNLLLDSALKSGAFGKIRIKNEDGFVAAIDERGEVSFTPWQFASIHIDENDIVHYCGTFSGKTLLSVLRSGGALATKAATAALIALTAAMQQGTALETVGAGGIVVSEDGLRVLFLPAECFERAARNHTDAVYAAVQGVYVKKGLVGASSLAFTRAAIAYQALSGFCAFPAANTDERQVDMFDANFVPLELRVQGLDPALSHAINSGLEIQPLLRIVPGEKRIQAGAQAKIVAQQEQAIKSFSVQQFAAALVAEKPAVTDAERAAFALQREEWEKKQSASIHRRRFLRRNRTRLIALLCTIGIVCAAVTSFVRENEGLATSVGLTSRQTIETLYTGIHTCDVNVVRQVTHGKTMKNLLTIVSGVYVSGKQRSVMQQSETLTPAEWFYFKNTSDFWQYGLTQFTVDNTVGCTNFAYPRRKDKKAPLTQEDGVSLAPGQTVQHAVSYYRVYNDGSIKLAVEKVSDIVTLTWRKNRWIVTDVQSEASETSVKVKDFRADYDAALLQSENDVTKAVSQLREKYAWLPTDAELAAAGESVSERYRLVFSPDETAE